jgi:hypothetical protein
MAELEALAAEANPAIRYWDPLGLANGEFWGTSQEATISFLRHAEIKHGRVAMAAFVGYVTQANHIFFPWKTVGGDAIDFSSMTPPEQWDALPDAAKWQIILFVGVLEVISESSTICGKHYMAGGRPGEYPSFTESTKAGTGMVHPVPFDLYDPFGQARKRSPESKARGLVAEINNGRLAMIGFFGFLAESKIPGSVPALTGLHLPAYSGEYMAPF